MPLGVLPWPRGTRFASRFQKNESKVPRSSISGDDGKKRKKKRKTDGEGGRPFPPTPQKESLEIPRHMLHGTSRLLTRPHSRNVRHPLSPSYPPSLFSSRCSREEIQIYAPTAPGVFFELMKNESGRARPSPPLPFLSSRGLPPPLLAFSPRARVS